jgi:hypothetical protein
MNKNQLSKNLFINENGEINEVIKKFEDLEKLQENKVITTSQMLLIHKLRRINETLRKFQPDEKIKCCLCDKVVNEFGNNAEPLIEDGICCNKCNWEKVIPARIKE